MSKKEKKKVRKASKRAIEKKKKRPELPILKKKAEKEERRERYYKELIKREISRAEEEAEEILEREGKRPVKKAVKDFFKEDREILGRLGEIKEEIHEEREKEVDRKALKRKFPDIYKEWEEKGEKEDVRKLLWKAELPEIDKNINGNYCEKVEKGEMTLKEAYCQAVTEEFEEKTKDLLKN